MSLVPLPLPRPHLSSGSVSVLVAYDFRGDEEMEVSRSGVLGAPSTPRRGTLKYE